MTNQTNNRIKFFSEISQRQIEAREFFSETLVDSIRRNFGFYNVLISYFDTEGNILSCIKGRDYLTRHSAELYNSFIKNDVIRKEVYQDAIRDQLTYFDIAPKLYKSTDYIKEDYQKSEHVRFIQDNYDATYSATMPFGINAYIQITFFKTLEQGDFTATELVRLEELYVYIANAYKNFKKHEQMKIVSDIQSKIIEGNDRAYVIVDYFMNVMSYNKEAVEYLSDIFGPSIERQLEANMACHWITVLMGVEQDEEETKITRVKNYCFTIHHYDQCYSNGIIDKYYWITIAPKDEETRLETEINIDILTAK